jgi:hypothetical protein
MHELPSGLQVPDSVPPKDAAGDAPQPVQYRVGVTTDHRVAFELSAPVTFRPWKSAQARRHVGALSVRGATKKPT